MVVSAGDGPGDSGADQSESPPTHPSELTRMSSDNDPKKTPLRPLVIIVDDQLTGRKIMEELVRSIDASLEVETFADPYEALDRIAAKLKKTDPDEAFFYFSGRSSNEAGFLLQLCQAVAVQHRQEGRLRVGAETSIKPMTLVR